MIVTVTLNPSLDEWVHVPRLRLGALHRTAQTARYPGGKGINVSRVVHELGLPTTALAVAGGDDGHILSHLLTQRHISHHFVTVRGSTRNNYQIQTDVPEAITQINGAGPRVSSGTLRQVARRIATLPRATQVLVCSGSLPPGAPPQTYATLLRAAHLRNVLTVLDASGPALRAGVAARPWFIKPNQQEAEALVGHALRTRAALINAARQLADKGPSIVIISLGAEGAVLAVRDSSMVWWALPPRVRVRSTVGAGDSLVAGFVVGWLKTQRVLDAFRLGMACGAATVMTTGTELCHAADVRRLRSRIRIQAVR